jgi:hypothetical protein
VLHQDDTYVPLLVGLLALVVRPLLELGMLPPVILVEVVEPVPVQVFPVPVRLHTACVRLALWGWTYDHLVTPVMASKHHSLVPLPAVASLTT